MKMSRERFQQSDRLFDAASLGRLRVGS